MGQPASPDKEAASQESPVEQISELVRRMCVAQSNVAMYSGEHPVALESLQSAFEELNHILRRKKKALTISMSEGRILFEGLPIEEKNPMVARLAHSLEEIHANNLFFKPGITLEEFSAFYDLLSKGSDYINTEGGLKDLLLKEKIRHIETREASYVLITEDDKIVSKDAKIDTTGLGTSSVDAEIINFMVSQVVKKAEEQKWLINEFKNHPQKMAQRILDGIELATSQAEMGMSSETDNIEALIQNIKIVGKELAAKDEDAETQDLEKAVVTLERELKMRSRTLMSDKVASGFVNEILGVITSFSEHASAEQVTGEFIKGERTLKKTEKLLHDIKPQAESKAEFLRRVHDVISKQDVDEEDVEEIKEELAPKRKKRKKRKKSFDKAVEDGVRQRIRKLHVEGEEAEDVSEKLMTFVDNKVKEKEREFKERVHRRDRFLELPNVGIVIWNDDGVVEFINSAAKEKLEIKEGYQLREDLLETICDLDFPLMEPPECPEDIEPWDATELAILATIQNLMTDEENYLIGATFTA